MVEKYRLQISGWKGGDPNAALRMHLRRLFGCTGCMPWWDSLGAVRLDRTLQDLIDTRSDFGAPVLCAVAF